MEVACETCEGTGVEIMEEHHPDCDGHDCGRFGCPIEFEEPCGDCGGEGFLTDGDGSGWF